jgi:hypothetical protein
VVGRKSCSWCNRNEPICFSPYLYRARNLVERFFNRIKHCRRIATRYDKLAANYLAFVQLASIRLWLRVNESTSYALTKTGVPFPGCSVWEVPLSGNGAAPWERRFATSAPTRAVHPV